MIAHVEHLRPDLLSAFLHRWPSFDAVQEKLDGLHLRVGRDAVGYPWASRMPKARVQYHHPTEWPAQPWTRWFRLAHEALVTSGWVETNLGPGEHCDIEILTGGRTNVVDYAPEPRLVVLDAAHAVVPCRVASVSEPIQWTLDGLGDVVLPDLPAGVRIALESLDAVLSGQREIMGQTFTVAEILGQDLRRRPDSFTVGEWADARSDFRFERDLAGLDLAPLVHDIVAGLRPVLTGIRSQYGADHIEGLVVRNCGSLVKLVDPTFRLVNPYLHYVQKLFAEQDLGERHRRWFARTLSNRVAQVRHGGVLRLAQYGDLELNRIAGEHDGQSGQEGQQDLAGDLPGVC
ncbi:hypothetical protein [Azospirillum sp. sgz301742]